MLKTSGTIVQRPRYSYIATDEFISSLGTRKPVLKEVKHDKETIAFWGLKYVQLQHHRVFSSKNFSWSGTEAFFTDWYSRKNALDSHLTKTKEWTDKFSCCLVGRVRSDCDQESTGSEPTTLRSLAEGTIACPNPQHWNFKIQAK